MNNSTKQTLIVLMISSLVILLLSVIFAITYYVNLNYGIHISDYLIVLILIMITYVTVSQSIKNKDSQ